MIVNRPVDFDGTDEEKRENFLTHHFVNWDDEYRCSDCDCKPWHVAAKYPCGYDVPRETVTISTTGDE